MGILSAGLGFCLAGLSTDASHTAAQASWQLAVVLLEPLKGLQMICSLGSKLLGEVPCLQI